MGATLALLLVMVGFLVTGRHLLLPESEAVNTSTVNHNEIRASLPSADSSKNINLTLVIKPQDAQVSLDGRLLPPGTTIRTIPLDNRTHVLVIAAPGYRTFERHFQAVADYQLIVDLTPEKGSRRSSKDPTGKDRATRDPSLRSNPYNKIKSP